MTHLLRPFLFLISLTFSLMVVSSAIARTELTDFAGRDSDIIRLLRKSQGWGPRDVKRKKLTLTESKPVEAIEYSSELECGTRTCTRYLFEKEGSGKFRWIGTIEGSLEILPQPHHDHFDIQSTSSLGGKTNEAVNTVYQFDGRHYQIEKGPAQ